MPHSEVIVMRIAIDAPPVRSLSANEKMVYQFLKEGLTPIEIARRMKLPVGRNNFSDNRYDVPAETITRLITSIREKGWDIPTNTKEEAEMPRITLTEEDKRSIVTANQAGASVTELAAKYNIAKGTVYNIVSEWKKRGETALSGETEVETKEEPETAATETGSEQEIVEAIPADIIPETEENVKPESEENAEPLIPQAVIEACWGRMDELRNQIAAEQAVIDDWERQIAEIKDFLELARIANPLGGTV